MAILFRGMVRARTVVVTASLLLTTAAHAQTTDSSPASCAVTADQAAAPRTLSGSVSDTQGARVSGATVTARCGPFVQRTQTTADGLFTLRLPPSSPASGTADSAAGYTLRVERPGFDIAEQHVAITPQRDTELQVTLAVARLTDAVTVRGTSAPTNSVTATKTDTPLLETPQAVTVISRQLIIEQGATTVQGALNYAAGVRSEAFGADSRSDNMFVRGGYPDEYLDGLRQQVGGYYTSTTRNDPYLLERVEVLRGPSAMLYGQGGTAGVVNLVSKRPLSTPFREIGVQFGTFNRKQVQVDVAGPFVDGSRWRYRLVAVGRDADTQVDFVRDNRALVAPSVTWQATDATVLTVQMRWQADRTGSTPQFLPWNGTVAPNPNGRLPTDRFVGEPSMDRYDSDRLTGGWLLEHRFSSDWVVRQNVRLSRNKVDYRQTYPDSFSRPGNAFIDANQRVLDRVFSIEQPTIGMLAADQHAEGHLRTGIVRHQLLLGLDALRLRQTKLSFFDIPIQYGGHVAPIDVYAPVYAPFTPGPLVDNPLTTQRQLGMYVQDQMHVGPRWIAVAGVRHDRTWNAQEEKPDENDHATSKRVGLMYAAAGGWSPYVSYTESFAPVTGTDRFNTRFKPVRGQQVEGGLKFQPPGAGYSVTAAVFQLREKNRLLYTDPSLPAVQAGRTKSKGLELEFQGEVTRSLAISAHYNYLDNDPLLDTLPPHQTAIWGRQRFRIGAIGDCSAGLGVRYMGSFKDGIAPETPSVTLLDAMLSWDHPHWRYAVNINNLTNKSYVSTCLARGDCFIGSRRAVMVTAGYRY